MPVWAPTEEACQGALLGLARCYQSASITPMDTQNTAQGSETLLAEQWPRMLETLARVARDTARKMPKWGAAQKTPPFERECT